MTRALTRAFEAREKAVRAREVALTALNIPSASDIERLTRRVRSVSQRLEGIEDIVDRVDGRFAALNANAGVEGRLSAIEEQLGAISRELAAIHQASPARPRPCRASRSASWSARSSGQRRTAEAVVGGVDRVGASRQSQRREQN